MMKLLDIEYAAFISCPAIDQSLQAGMLLRSNGGYTKRANSATAICDVTGNYRKVIQACEAYFEDRGQPSVFRLLSILDIDEFDTKLADRGYQSIEKTLVMSCPLPGISRQRSKINSLSGDDWIDAFYQISGDKSQYKRQHLEMLLHIKSPCLTAAVRDATGAIAALGIGVVENGYFGIFNIVTAKNQQRKGYSTILISELMSWANSTRAHTAYVQVRAENNPAVELYKKLGYQENYHYWYRVTGE